MPWFEYLHEGNEHSLNGYCVVKVVICIGIGHLKGVCILRIINPKRNKALDNNN